MVICWTTSYWEALGKAIESVAVSLRYPEPDLKKTGAYIRSLLIQGR